MTPKNF